MRVRSADQHEDCPCVLVRHRRLRDPIDTPMTYEDAGEPAKTISIAGRPRPHTTRTPRRILTKICNNHGHLTRALVSPADLLHRPHVQTLQPASSWLLARPDLLLEGNMMLPMEHYHTQAQQLNVRMQMGDCRLPSGVGIDHSDPIHLPPLL